MRCAVPHHATPANMGCAFHVFLTTTTTTTLVVANLRLGDWNESWSPRTEQNTATKLQQNIESGGTTFFVCFLHIVTFILVDILVFLLTSYIHCVSVYCIFLHSFFPLPWLVSALNKLCYNASDCVHKSYFSCIWWNKFCYTHHLKQLGCLPVLFFFASRLDVCLSHDMMNMLWLDWWKVGLFFKNLKINFNA